MWAARQRCTAKASLVHTGRNLGAPCRYIDSRINSCSRCSLGRSCHAPSPPKCQERFAFYNQFLQCAGTWSHIALCFAVYRDMVALAASFSSCAAIAAGQGVLLAEGVEGRDMNRSARLFAGDRGEACDCQAHEATRTIYV